MPELRYAMEPVTLVIPIFNEAATIGAVLAIPEAYRGDFIVADGGSREGTQEIARAGGARVINAGRGYGRACALGAAAARPENRVIVFIDGDGADRGDLIGRIAGPVVAGAYDLVLASRTRGTREPDAMLWHQVLAGRLAGFGMGARHGVRYPDMCAFRAINRDALEHLGLREMTYGWNIERSQVRCAGQCVPAVELLSPSCGP
jgi:glycosyltransferase involved in cell wall biosynthesis